MNSFLEPATLLKIILKWLTLLKNYSEVFSWILLKCFRGLVLQNTLYICSKQVVHGLFKIIQNYISNAINNKKLLVS